MLMCPSSPDSDHESKVYRGGITGSAIVAFSSLGLPSGGCGGITKVNTS